MKRTLKRVGTFLLALGIVAGVSLVETPKEQRRADSTEQAYADLGGGGVVRYCQWVRGHYVCDKGGWY